MKNNIGYTDYYSEKKEILKEIEGLKTLPPGMYQYDNLGQILLEIEKVDELDIPKETIKTFKGFIIISHYNVKTKYEIVISNNTSIKDKILYAYLADNNKLTLALTPISNTERTIGSIDILENLDLKNTPYYDDITEYNFLTRSFINFTFLPYYFYYGEVNRQFPGRYNENKNFTDIEYVHKLHGPLEKKENPFFLGELMISDLTL